MNAHPPLEDIAAFLDDMLSAEERARITEHLARCESCYEIFAGAAHFQSAEDTDGGGVIPFPLKGEQDRRIPRWLLLAASVVLAAGLGFFAWQYLAPPKIAVADLVEPLQEQPRIAEHLYQPTEVTRSGEEPTASFSDAPPFMAGIYLIDLRLSVQAKEAEKTKDVLYALFSELDQISGMRPLAAKIKKEADQMREMKSTDPLRRLEQTLPQWEGELQELLSDSFFSFGLWAEAGRLSAITGSPEFFEQPANRRFISPIERKIRSLQDARYALLLKDLRQIESHWPEAEHLPENRKALSERFQSIIASVEQIQRQDAEDAEDFLLPK
jgi:hypothetical protein